mmetsp:Transcript_98841/g.221444  ORF Transcript_98841/g.221444 Transcript_98841/m.221444 type:complete len:360 (-) Transcript_98841:126-1205(-)
MPLPFEGHEANEELDREVRAEEVLGEDEDRVGPHQGVRRVVVGVDPDPDGVDEDNDQRSVLEQVAPGYSLPRACVLVEVEHVVLLLHHRLLDLLLHRGGVDKDVLASPGTRLVDLRALEALAFLTAVVAVPRPRAQDRERFGGGHDLAVDPGLGARRRREEGLLVVVVHDGSGRDVHLWRRDPRLRDQVREGNRRRDVGGAARPLAVVLHHRHVVSRVLGGPHLLLQADRLQAELRDRELHLRDRLHARLLDAGQGLLLLPRQRLPGVGQLLEHRSLGPADLELPLAVLPVLGRVNDLLGTLRRLGRLGRLFTVAEVVGEADLLHLHVVLLPSLVHLPRLTHLPQVALRVAPGHGPRAS